MRLSAAALLAALALSQPAAAATADFLDLPSGEVGGPLTRLAATPGAMTLDAPDGLFANGAGLLSTTYDLDAALNPVAVTIDFAETQAAVGLRVGVLDAGFGWLSGQLRITVDGVAALYALLAAGPADIALPVAGGADQIVIEVAAFDVDASSVGFVGLQSVTVGVAPIPLPPAAALLAAALAGLAAAGRRRSAAA